MTEKKSKKIKGRPKLPNGKALGVKIQIRLSPEEADLLRKVASKTGASLSSWARITLTQAAKRAIKK